MKLSDLFTDGCMENVECGVWKMRCTENFEYGKLPDNLLLSETRELSFLENCCHVSQSSEFTAELLFGYQAEYQPCPLPYSILLLG